MLRPANPFFIDVTASFLVPRDKKIIVKLVPEKLSAFEGSWNGVKIDTLGAETTMLNVFLSYEVMHLVNRT